MGFSRDRVVDALRLSSNDVERATGVLLMQWSVQALPVPAAVYVYTCKCTLYRVLNIYSMHVTSMLFDSVWWISVRLKVYSHFVPVGCVAQWLNVGLWPANFPCPLLGLQLMGDHLFGWNVRCRSANQADSAFNPFKVDKWVIGCN